MRLLHPRTSATPAPTLATAEPGETGPGTASTVLRNASVLTLAAIVARLAGFALAIFMGRYLGASEYGRFGYASALSTILVPIADFGVTTYLIRETARDRETTDRALGTLLRAKVTLTAALIGVAGVATALLSDTRTTVVVLLVLLAGIADGFSIFVFGYFRGRERMGLEGKLTSGTSLIRSAAGIVIVVATGELVPVLVLMLTTSTVQLAIAARRLRRVIPGSGIDLNLGLVRWRTVGSLGSLFLLTMIYTRADSVLVGWLKDDRSVGLYTAGYTLMLGLQIAPFMVATALVPVFARTHDSSQEIFRSAWNEGIRIVLLLSLPFSLVVSLLGPAIMRLVFGAEYGAGGTALAIVVWCSPLVAFNTILTGALRGAGRDRWLTSAAGLGVVLNVGLNLWAIPAFGITGAATTTVATEALVGALMFGVAVRRRIVPLPHVPFVRLGASLLALAVVVVVAGGLPVAVLAPLALLAYLVAVLVTGVIRRSDLRLVRGLRSG